MLLFYIKTNGLFVSENDFTNNIIYYSNQTIRILQTEEDRSNVHSPIFREEPSWQFILVLSYYKLIKAAKTHIQNGFEETKHSATFILTASA